MNRKKTGQSYNIQRLNLVTQQQNRVGSTLQQERSSMERNSVACASLSNHDYAGILDTRSRFEQVFLSSPRAQVNVIGSININKIT